MSRLGWLVVVLLLAAAAAYVAYDVTRYCTGGPLTQLVRSVLAGGTYSVRCAG